MHPNNPNHEQRVKTLLLIDQEYPHQEPLDDLLDEHMANDGLPRYVLVEEHSSGNCNLTPIENEKDAIDYWKGSSPDEWLPRYLIDLDTGATWDGNPIYDCVFTPSMKTFSPIAQSLSTHEAKKLLEEAAGLWTDAGESNPEYERALIELIIRSLGLNHDEHSEHIREAILAKRQEARA